VSQELLLGVEPQQFLKLDLEAQKDLWRNRFGILGRYAPGPTAWIERIKQAQREGEVAVKRLSLEFEKEEQELSSSTMSVVEQIKPEGFEKVMIMACGTGRLIPECLALLATNGQLHGVDMLAEHVNFVNEGLENSGECNHWRPFGNPRYQIYQGLATDQTEEQDVETFDVEVWSRLGNHILNDAELNSAHEQTIRRLKVGGWLVLAESFTGKYGDRELNQGRLMSSGSKFRNINSVIKLLTPKMEVREQLVKKTRFAGDEYLVVPFQKVS